MSNIIDLNSWDSVPSDKLETSKYIKRIKSPISYDNFFNNHLLPNSPCLLDGCFTKDWRARIEWVNSKGTPDLEYLTENFGKTL